MIEPVTGHPLLFQKLGQQAIELEMLRAQVQQLSAELVAAKSQPEDPDNGNAVSPEEA